MTFIDMLVWCQSFQATAFALTLVVLLFLAKPVYWSLAAVHLHSSGPWSYGHRFPPAKLEYLVPCHWYGFDAYYSVVP